MYGAGSIGLVLGALMTKNGVDIDLVDTDEEQIEALRKNGAVLRGSVECTVPVRAIYPEDMTPGYDVIFLAINSNYNDEVVPKIKGLLKEDGVVVTLQNGLPEIMISAIVGENRTMGCTIDWNAESVAPGCSVVHSDAEYLWSHIGKMNGVSSAQAMNARNLLSKACRLHYEKNLRGARWCKLLVNCSYSMVSVLYGDTFGKTISDWNARDLIIRCCRECLRVGMAVGVDFPKLEGLDYYKLADYRTIFKKWWCMAQMPKLIKHNVNTRTTQLQNYQKGKKMELEQLCGAIMNYGRSANIPTPVNDKIFRVASRLETGELKPGPELVKLTLQGLK